MGETMDLDKLGKLKIQKIIDDGENITYDRFEYLFKKYPNKTKYLIVNCLTEKGIDLIEEQELDETKEEKELVSSFEEDYFQSINKEFIFDEVKNVYGESKQINLLKIKEIFNFIDDVKIQEKIIQLLEINDYEFVKVDEISKNPLELDKEDFKGIDNRYLILEYKSGKEEYLDILIENNINLVRSRAFKLKSFLKNTLEDEDLIQEGIIGLKKAVERFELKEDTTFSTYAIYWIDQSIRRAIMDKGNLIRIPVHVYEKLFKILKIFNNTEITLEKITPFLNNDLEKSKFYLELLKNYLKVSTFDSVVEGTDGLVLADIIADNSNIDPQDKLEKEEFMEMIYKIINKKIYREVLIKRFGLEDQECMTLERIAQDYNISRERVRQIEVKALERLRNRINYEKYLGEE